MKALKITFKSNKLGKICTDSSVTRKTYNLEMAEKIAQRMEELEAADSVDMLGIAPGIVVGRLQKENIIPYEWYHDLKVGYTISS